jgi:hypothetical protein
MNCGYYYYYDYYYDDKIIGIKITGTAGLLSSEIWNT